MTTLRYLFGNLTSGDVIAELPLSGVSMSKKLNEWGTFRGTMYFDTSGINNVDIRAATTPGLCFVVVERDDVPIWDGIVWSASYNSQSKVLNITARTYDAYAEKQVIDVAFTRTATEQRNIFCDLWNQMQSSSSRNIGIQIPSTFMTVLTRDIDIQPSEFKTYAQAMSTLADNADGFDWTIDTTRVNNEYLRQLRIGYPYLGIMDPVQSALAFDYPGNILYYYQTESMTNAGTHLYLLGAGEGSDMAYGLAVQADQINNGFKRFDTVLTRKDIDNQATLSSMATQLGNTRRAPLRITKAFVKANAEPQFGSYGLGDTATLSIIDPRYPAGITASARIVAWEYRPQSDDSIDQVELIFEGDELNDE